MSDTALPSRSGFQIRRAAAVDDSWGTLTLQFTDVDPFTLPPDGVRTLFLWPKPIELVILQGDTPVFSQVLDMPADSKVEYRLDVAPAGLLRRLTGGRPKLALSETSRAYLAPYDPGPVQMLTQQIWIGTADSEDAFYALMNEDPAHYSEENEEAEGTDQFIPLTRFAKLMGQEYYDHDFVEYGFARPGDGLEARFKGASWVAQWAPIVRDMISPEAAAQANAFVIMGVEKHHNADQQPQIRTPRDVMAPGVSLAYLGEIEHPSH